jgi:hypothetical protein
MAVTDAAAFITTVHVPVPEHPPPDQPLNIEPDAGAAVSVTELPAAKVAEHVAPQLIPAGLEVTVPLPEPAVVTVSRLPLTLNVAVTDCAALIVTEHVPVPEQPPPDHPAKLDPDAGDAVNVTTVPLLKVAEHVAPQLIPEGLEVTVPLPAPAGVTVSA